MWDDRQTRGGDATAIARKTDRPTANYGSTAFTTGNVRLDNIYIYAHIIPKPCRLPKFEMYNLTARGTFFVSGNDSAAAAAVCEIFSLEFSPRFIGKNATNRYTNIYRSAPYGRFFVFQTMRLRTEYEIDRGTTNTWTPARLRNSVRKQTYSFTRFSGEFGNSRKLRGLFSFP